MKNQYAAFKLFLILGASTLFLSYSNNPPTGMTNAPGERFCGECHIPNFNLIGSMSIDVPSQVVKDSIYDITVTLTKVSTSILRAGFELVALKEDPNDIDGYSNAGTFIIEDGASLNIRPQDPSESRQYLAHAPAKNFGTDTVVTYSAKWQANMIDETNQKVYFYASGMLANGNGTNTGDRPFLVSSNANILPIEFSNLKCLDNVYGHSISWDMSGLENTQKVVLQSSIDARSWTDYKEVAFSELKKQYVLELPSYTSSAYFRLSSYSFDEGTNYSDVILCGKNSLPLYPSLFTNQLYSDSDLSKLNIMAYTIDGQELHITKNRDGLWIEGEYKGLVLLRYGGSIHKLIKM